MFRVMNLLKLRIWNFRRFSMMGDFFDSAQPGIKVYFKDELNVLVGDLLLPTINVFYCIFT